MLTYYFSKSWWEMICSLIFSQKDIGQRVMNPFDVIHSTLTLCTSKTYYIFAKRKLPKIAWKGFDLKLRAMWEGLWHNGEIFSLRTITFCPATLQETISGKKKEKTALKVLCHDFYLTMQIYVWKFNFALCQMIHLFQNAFLSKISHFEKENNISMWCSLIKKRYILSL